MYHSVEVSLLAWGKTEYSFLTLWACTSLVRLKSSHIQDRHFLLVPLVKTIPSRNRNDFLFICSFIIRWEVQISLVVTQIYRATQAFEDVGVAVVPRPTNFVTFDFPDASFISRLQFQEFVPSLDGLERTTQILDEYLSTMYYFLRGWLAPLELVRPNG